MTFKTSDGLSNHMSTDTSTEPGEKKAEAVESVA